MLRVGERHLVVDYKTNWLGPVDTPLTTGHYDRDALREAMKTMRIKDAATAVAGALGLPRRQVYQVALGLEKE